MPSGRAPRTIRAPESARIELARALGRLGKLDQAIAILLPLAERKPELRLDLVRLLIQKTSRQPRDQRSWPEVERHLREAEKALPQAVESLDLLRVDLLAAQDRLEEARSLLSSAQAKEPRNLRVSARAGPAGPATGQRPRGLADPRPGRDRTWGRAWTFNWLAWTTGAWREATRPRPRWPSWRGLASESPSPTGPRSSIGSLRSRSGSASRPWPGSTCASSPDCNRTTSRSSWACSIWPCRPRTTPTPGISSTKIRAIEGERGTIWRLAQASCLLDQARRGGTKDLEVPRRLAEEIAARRPDWWGASLLLAEIAELEGHTDQAIKNYTRAIELGNAQPPLARRLVGLLNQKNQFDQIERVVKILSDRGMTAADLVIATALNAIRQHDYDRGIALARQVFSESSTNFCRSPVPGTVLPGRWPPQRGRQGIAPRRRARPGSPHHLGELRPISGPGEAARSGEGRRGPGAKALPADRAGLALAQCYALVGETEQAETMIQAALDSPTCDLTTIRAAVDLYINLGRFDQVEPILDKLRAPAMKATPEMTWPGPTGRAARCG